MRKLAAVVLCSVFVVWFNCPGSRTPGPVDPDTHLDPARSYTVVYWDVDLPALFDPQGLYKPAVEKLAADFSNEYPMIAVEVRWLPWAEAEEELRKALRDGNPPDLWAEWQGLARMDHVLQVPASIWLDPELLAPAGRRVVSHDGQIWAWPRWLWPRGLLIFRDSLALGNEELEKLIFSQWDWTLLGEWLARNDLYLDVNDWQGEFSAQVLLAATGYGVGQWGGQELNQVFAALEVLMRQGRISASGEYRKITRGKNMVGGTAPVFATWLVENMPEEQLVLLPIPSVNPETVYYPMSSANLVQFRQAKYKGDDHSLAAALVAEYMAMGQARELSAAFWAVPAWINGEWDNSNLPTWYYSFLVDAAQKGMPLYCVDRLGRAEEMRTRKLMNAVLQDFWAGKADAHDVARRLEELR
jgi:ABC-type glycerol-3-phosphate transport system substrate-binding protein